MRSLLFLLVAAVARCQAAPALDVLLPPGSTIVFGLRTANLLNLLAQQDGAKDIRQQASMLLATSPFSGFDPFKDIDEVVLATTGTGQNPPALIIITGRFDPAKMAQGARAYHNVPLIQNAKSKQVMAVLDASTLLAGDPPLVKAAIDRASSNVAAGPLAARIEDLRGRYDLWAFADHLDAAAAVPAGSLPPSAEALRSLDRFWFGAAFTRTFELAGELHLRTAKDASHIAAILRDFEKQAKAKMDASSPARIEITTAENSVALAVSIPEEEWKKALQSQARAQVQPQPKPVPQSITTDPTGNTVTLTLPGKK